MGRKGGGKETDREGRGRMVGQVSSARSPLPVESVQPFLKFSQRFSQGFGQIRLWLGDARPSSAVARPGGEAGPRRHRRRRSATPAPRVRRSTTRARPTPLTPRLPTPRGHQRRLPLVSEGKYWKKKNVNNMSGPALKKGITLKRGEI